MDGSTPSRPQTAAIVQKWRLRFHLSKQRFAELADVSATYVRTIEAGADDDGRTVIPSAGIIGKLVNGLAQAGATTAEKRQAYGELMAAAGYVDFRSVDAIAPPETDRTAAPPQEGEIGAPNEWLRMDTVDRARMLRDAASADDGRVEGLLVTLIDPRLLDHLVPLLERWDELDADDQATLLGVARLIAERRNSHRDTR